jgi:predicted DCC family thiol-disulfide oxidoreductase YuxK
LTLVYDGECEFCTRLAGWVRRQDRRGRIAVRANQEAGLVEALGLSREEVGRAAWAVEAGGRKFEGAAAIGWVEDRYYARVARRRAWW